MSAARQFTHEELMLAQRQLELLKKHEKKQDRELRIVKARSDLIQFTKLMMPDPEHHDDVTVSRYQDALHHRSIAKALENLESGKYFRLIVNCPPRHGKSELTSRNLPAWFIGRDPYRSVIFATYNDTLARDFGRDVRKLMKSPMYREIFPNTRLETGSASAEELRTTAGGQLVFVGRGGSLTGRGADLLIIDDPIKDDKEAKSVTIREQLWHWYSRVAMSRLMSATGRVIVIQTRWHEDDLTGRITDPSNECYSQKEASMWKVIDLPALAEENDILGREVDEPLWPERFDFNFLAASRERDAKGFAALYQGRPAPDDGDYFKRNWLRTYNTMADVPKNLRIYGASDHAVSTQRSQRDYTVLLIFGVDPSGMIWILDCWWYQKDTGTVVDAMLFFMKKYKPIRWWAESGHISKSIGPFLRKLMMEKRIFCPVMEITPVADKETRAQSISGRMSMGMVNFPVNAPWWGRAENEILKFPQARNDDFVDGLSLIGLGLDSVFGPSSAAPDEEPEDEAQTGTLAWIKQQSRAQRQQDRLQAMESGMH